MTLPISVKVGAINYAVEKKTFVEIDDNKNYMGKCTYSDSRIEIAESLSKNRENEVFVHELLHAILNEAGYDEHDEDLVNRAAKVLHQVLSENSFDFLRGD